MDLRVIRNDTAFRFCGLAFRVFCLWASIVSLLAQSTGSVVGIVTDSTGGSFPNGSITLTNTDTSERRAAQTDTNGNYQFVSVLPGKYRIEIGKDGFKRFATEFTIQVESTSRVDAVMQVGDVTQTVEVTGRAALLQTDNAVLGQIVKKRQVEEMPRNGRNVMNLVSLAPAVVTHGGAG